MLDLAPAERIKSGIGGVMSLLGGVGLRNISSAPKLSALASGLDGRLPDRIRLKVLSLIRRPANGAAVTMVPGIAVGGGVGLLERKSG